MKYLREGLEGREGQRSSPPAKVFDQQTKEKITCAATSTEVVCFAAADL